MLGSMHRYRAGKILKGNTSWDLRLFRVPETELAVFDHQMDFRARQYRKCYESCLVKYRGLEGVSFDIGASYLTEGDFKRT